MVCHPDFKNAAQAAVCCTRVVVLRVLDVGALLLDSTLYDLPGTRHTLNYVLLVVHTST